LPGLEADGLAGRDPDLVTGPGIAPDPFLRGLTWKTPKPRSSILSPRFIASFIASSTASTATTDFTFVMSATVENLVDDVDFDHPSWLPAGP
jgi:hypothetical protein